MARISPGLREWPPLHLIIGDQWAMVRGIQGDLLGHHREGLHSHRHTGNKNMVERTHGHFPIDVIPCLVQDGMFVMGVHIRRFFCQVAGNPQAKANKLVIAVHPLCRAGAAIEIPRGDDRDAIFFCDYITDLCQLLRVGNTGKRICLAIVLLPEVRGGSFKQSAACLLPQHGPGDRFGLDIVQPLVGHKAALDLLKAILFIEYGGKMTAGILCTRLYIRIGKQRGWCLGYIPENGRRPARSDGREKRSARFGWRSSRLPESCPIYFVCTDEYAYRCFF